MKKDLEILWELQRLEANCREIAAPDASMVKELKSLKKKAEDLKAVFEKEKLQLETLKRDNRRKEAELEGIRIKIKEADELLYGGSSQSAKELEQIQKKVARLKEQVSEIEDDVLENMEAAEQIEQELLEIKILLNKTIKDFKDKYDEYGRLKGEREKAIREVTAKIEKIREKTDPKLLEWFMAQRTKFPDRKAVAAIINGSCDGCNMVVSFELRKKLSNDNNSDNLTCENCGRVIFQKRSKDN